MAEAVQRVTYARVAAGATPNAATERLHDPGLDEFLLEHVAKLRGFAAGRTSCPAIFHEDQARDLFDLLRTGTKAEFLNSAHQVTTRLIGQMNGTTKPGLLVCVQINDGTTRTAAVLKLEVVTPNAANLELLDSGEEELQSVTNVMDAPGKLQKGALVGDTRPGSEVVMGDISSTEAQYFPRAFGITIEQRPNLAVADTLAEIRSVYGSAVEADVRRALPAAPPGDIDAVMEVVGQSVPSFADEAARQALRARLASKTRPVRNIDTGVLMTEVVTAGSVTVTAPADQERITWHPNDGDGGGFIITARVDEQPEREYRRS